MAPVLDDLSVSTVLKGAAAGAAATWTMNQVTTWMYEHESDAAREREDRARGGQTAYVSAASRLAGAAGLKLEEAQRARAGTALHWATGVMAGMAYAIARQRWPAVSRANGLPFGIGFFLLIDEAMNTAFGFTPPPRAFPWQAHARGAAGHVVFGLVTHTALAALDRLIPRRRQFEALLSAN